MAYRAYGKCTKCEKWMSHEEAVASAMGAENKERLLCDNCWTPSSPTTDTELEKMFDDAALA